MWVRLHVLRSRKLHHLAEYRALEMVVAMVMVYFAVLCVVVVICFAAYCGTTDSVRMVFETADPPVVSKDNMPDNFSLLLTVSLSIFHLSHRILGLLGFSWDSVRLLIAGSLHLACRLFRFNTIRVSYCGCPVSLFQGILLIPQY
jgi:hypothetical protein